MTGKPFLVSGRNTLIHKIRKLDLLIINGDDNPAVIITHKGIKNLLGKCQTANVMQNYKTWNWSNSLILTCLEKKKPCYLFKPSMVKNIKWITANIAHHCLLKFIRKIPFKLICSMILKIPVSRAF